MKANPWNPRVAVAADADRISALIAQSARGLGQAHYAAAQIEAALEGTFGLDSQLVRDGTYFVVEAGGELAGAGGWSLRRTLFGGDAGSARDAALLDPACDAARIRAFFVAPAYARQGIASALLRACEAAALAAGFKRLELMATLPGVPFYRARGYEGGASLRWPLRDGLAMDFLPMHKVLG